MSVFLLAEPCAACEHKGPHDAHRAESGVLYVYCGNCGELVAVYPARPRRLRAAA